MSGILLPVDMLSPQLAELARRATKDGVAHELMEGEAGAALLYLMLFEKWPELLGEPAREVRLYNQYFWFTRFVALRNAERDFDAGLDQQQHQILERADFEVDFRILSNSTMRQDRGASRAHRAASFLSRCTRS